LNSRRAYEAAKGEIETAERLHDLALEGFKGSTGHAVPARPLCLQRAIEQLDRASQAKDRLIAIWTAFRSDRLALYRDLGELPFSDWKTFYADLSAGTVVAGPAPAGAVKPGVSGPTTMRGAAALDE
jgi:hypothetical protein